MTDNDDADDGVAVVTAPTATAIDDDDVVSSTERLFNQSKNHETENEHWAEFELTEQDDWSTTREFLRKREQNSHKFIC